MDILKSIGEHLLVLAPVTRAAVAEVIVKDALLPVLRKLVESNLCDIQLKQKKRKMSLDKYNADDDEVMTIQMPFYLLPSLTLSRPLTLSIYLSMYLSIYLSIYLTIFYGFTNAKIVFEAFRK